LRRRPVRPRRSIRATSMKLRKRPALRWKFRSQSFGSTVKRTTDSSRAPMRERKRLAMATIRNRSSRTTRGRISLQGGELIQIEQQNLAAAADRHLLLVRDRRAVAFLQLLPVDLHAAACDLEPAVALRGEGVRDRAAVEDRRIQRDVLMDRHRAVARVARSDEAQAVAALVFRKFLLLVRRRDAAALGQ